MSTIVMYKTNMCHNLASSATPVSLMSTKQTNIRSLEEDENTSFRENVDF